jgi:hypothetical protein
LFAGYGDLITKVSAIDRLAVRAANLPKINAATDVTKIPKPIPFADMRGPQLTMGFPR